MQRDLQRIHKPETATTAFYRLSGCLPECLSGWLCGWLPVWLPACVVCLSVCLYAGLSVCLSVHLSVCREEFRGLGTNVSSYRLVVRLARSVFPNLFSVMAPLKKCLHFVAPPNQLSMPTNVSQLIQPQGKCVEGFLHGTPAVIRRHPVGKHWIRCPTD